MSEARELLGVSKQLINHYAKDARLGDGVDLARLADEMLRRARRVMSA